MAALPQPRLTQQQRRERMRQRLLVAAVDCLAEQGYAGTTVTQVQERAGVARGAVLHHFPAKAELMVAATEHLVMERISRLRVEATRVPAGTDRVEALVDLAWTDLTGPQFYAALELWVAARTDAALRATLLPVQHRLFRALHEALSAVLEDEHGEDPRTATLVELTLDVLTGLSMSTMLDRGTGEPDAARPGQPAVVLARWKRVLAVLLGEHAPASWL